MQYFCASATELKTINAKSATNIFFMFKIIFDVPD